MAKKTDETKQTPQYTNQLQGAVGALTNLSPDKLPADISSTWPEEYDNALKAEGLSLTALVNAPDRPHVAVWPSNDGLQAEYIAKADSKRQFDSRTRFLALPPKQDDEVNGEQ